MLDLGGPEVSYCGRLLADLGADVLKVEPPEGDPARAYPPFFEDTPGPERSLSFLYRNTGKRCLRLDLEDAGGHVTLERLLTAADFVVDSFAPGYLAGLWLEPQARAEGSGLIWVSVSPFGHVGPRAGQAGSDLVAFARSGSMHLSGMVGEAPCGAPGQMAYDAAGGYAALALMVAHFHRLRTGEGQWVDLAVEDAAMAGIYPWSLPIYSSNNQGLAQARRLSPQSLPLLECKDGYVRFNLFLRNHWQAFVEMLGNPEVLLQPEWDQYEFRTNHHDLLRVLALCTVRDEPERSDPCRSV